jgi:hypothetical protein
MHLAQLNRFTSITSTKTLCLQAGHPEPEFFERARGFCVLLRSKQNIGTRVIKEEAMLKFEELIDRQREILNIIKEQKITSLGSLWLN